MGCTCSVSSAEQLAEVQAKHADAAAGDDRARRAGGPRTALNSSPHGGGHHFGGRMMLGRRGSTERRKAAAAARVVDAAPPPPVMEPKDLLLEAQRVLAEEEGAFPDVDELKLAATAVLQSQCQPDAVRLSADTGEARLGLCQVSLATACWLASECGRARHGLKPSAETVLTPAANLYYAAAYLQHLSAWGGSLQSERFAVCAYGVGPKGCDASAGSEYWDAYEEARALLARLWDSMQASTSGSGITMHIVAPGECLESVAAAAGCAPADILAANEGLDSARPGDCVALPVPALHPRLHVIRAGETLADVAARYGSTLGRLLRHNPRIKCMDAVAPGTLLMVPGLRTCALLEEEAALPRLRHVLHGGETARSVAAKYGLTAETLLAANPELRDPLNAPRGTQLFVPVA